MPVLKDASLVEMGLGKKYRLSQVRCTTRKLRYLGGLNCTYPRISFFPLPL
jgi:hypothetical protein